MPGSFRSRLTLLVLTVLLLSSIAATWVAISTYAREKNAVERTLKETAKALSLVVDRELRRHQDVADATSRMPAVTGGQWNRLENQLDVILSSNVRATHDQGRVLIVTDRAGNQVARFGGSHACPVGRDNAQVAALSGAAGRPQLFPLSTEGVVWFTSHAGDYVVYLAVPRHEFQSIIDEQALPDGWTAAILDVTGTVVARQPEPQRFVGTLAHPTLREQVRTIGEGFYATVTLDGTAVTAFYATSKDSGWAFAIGVPQTQMFQTIRTALIKVTAGALLLMGLALLLSAWMARDMRKALDKLRTAARDLEAGERVKVSPSGLVEVDEVAEAMGKAADRVLDANRILESQVAEAVAETKAAQTKLVQAQKMEAVGQLTGGIAHDFNNVLQSLMTGQQLLALHVNDPEAFQVLESCNRAVENASKLTRQLLAFGRRQSLHPSVIDLRDQLLGMRDLLKGALRENISLDIQMAPDLWPVYVDATQLELSILNCVINSRDAIAAKTSAGRVEISGLNVCCNAPGGETVELVELRIKDTGTGIAPEHLPKVFEPFFTTKDVGKGTGLGLAQVYAFATRSGGSVEIVSELGYGTEVIIRLPRAATDKVSRGPVASAGSAALQAVGGGRKLLFVEDDSLVSSVVGPALRGFGFHVTHVPTADEALELLNRGEHFDVLFSDVVMPGRANGFDLARTWRTRQPHTHLLLATGYSDRGTGIDGVQVLPKPYSLKALAAALAGTAGVNA